jgi:hypothetical protein
MPGPPRPESSVELAKRALDTAERIEADHEAVYGVLGNHLRKIGQLEERVDRLERRLERASADTPREQFVSSHDLQAAAERAAEIAIDKAEQTGRPMQVTTPSERVREIVKNERARAIVTVLSKIAIPVAIALSIVVTGLVIRDCQRGSVPALSH